MTVTLHAICHYRSKSDEWTDEWQDIDYKARNLIKAVKQAPFNGHSDFAKRGGGTSRIEDTPEGRAIAMAASGRTLADAIQAAGYENGFCIPIPSSTHVDPSCEFTGSRLVTAIQDAAPTLIAKPVLYFDQPMPSSSKGGGRNEAAILGHLRATSLISIDKAVVIDDVYTTGAHMRATVRYLRNAGVDVQDVFVLGRTAWERPEQMFRVAPEKFYFL